MNPISLAQQTAVPVAGSLLSLNIPNATAASVQMVVFDFDGVFTDNAVYVSETGEEMVRCNRSDGFGLSLLGELDISCCVISTEVNKVVLKRCQKLGITCYHGVNDKAQMLTDIAQQFDIPLERVAYVGNDINDIPCLQMVGVPIVVQDAFPLALAAAQYQTQRPGGHGAVREVCEWIVACYQAAQQT